MVKILTKSSSKTCGGFFGFIQIKTPKLSHMEPCANQSIVENNILDIQTTIKMC